MRFPLSNKAPMELAKNFDPNKSQFPAYAQIKYDGVPLTFTKVGPDDIIAITRQYEPCHSVPHLNAAAREILRNSPVGASFTAECLIPGQDFKISSGVIRRKEESPESADVVGVVFDYNVDNRRLETYFNRKKRFEEVLVQAKLVKPGIKFGIPHSILINDAAMIDQAWEWIQALTPNPIEGMMLHALAKPFQPGKRCWGMTRYKPQPTIDLEVVGFEEAVSEAGEPLGMVGRVNVRLLRKWPLDGVPDGWEAITHLSDLSGTLGSKIVGVGPGKLTHSERCYWWEQQELNQVGDKLFAEIKYMPDPSYEALRQPTIQRFRTDKDKSDVLEY